VNEESAGLGMHIRGPGGTAPPLGLGAPTARGNVGLLGEREFKIEDTSETWKTGFEIATIFAPGPGEGLVAEKVAAKAASAGRLARAWHWFKGLFFKEASGSAGSAANRASFEAYKNSLRAAMEKPVVTDARLGSLLDDLYRQGGTVGSGSTAAAVRHELATGASVGGRQHVQKAGDYAAALQRWIRNNPNARPGDRAAAENVLRDLENALGGR